MSDRKCVWIIEDVTCGGKVRSREMFNYTIKIDICANHYTDHLHTMFLHANGYDTEEILNQTPEWRKQEAETLMAAKGIKLEDIEV